MVQSSEASVIGCEAPSPEPVSTDTDASRATAAPGSPEMSPPHEASSRTEDASRRTRAASQCSRPAHSGRAGKAQTAARAIGGPSRVRLRRPAVGCDGSSRVVPRARTFAPGLSNHGESPRDRGTIDSLPGSPATPFLAVTDKAWFDFLSSRASGGYLDEVNFWSPRSTRPMKRMALGEPVFFRLKSPVNAIAGYGFFAHFAALDLEVAWQCFGWKNGDPDRGRFLRRIGEYRGVDLLARGTDRAPIGCTILRSVQMWPEARWIAWGPTEGWARNIVQGKTEVDAVRGLRLLSQIQASDQLIPDLDEAPFQPIVVDDRLIQPRDVAVREGQGAFRARLLDAYGRRCAITGEHTEPVLDAAHIQRYLGPKSNHVQNGLLLTKEFHTLFDLGYVTVTPEHVVRVSPSLNIDWNNGKRYYPYDGKALVAMPGSERLRPSATALEWHNENVFRRAG